MKIKKSKLLEITGGRSDLVTVQFKCSEAAATEGLMKLIHYIGKNGNTGHSFSIVVDPKDEREKSFGFDGDGSAYIDTKSIKMITPDGQSIGVSDEDK